MNKIDVWLIWAKINSFTFFILYPLSFLILYLLCAEDSENQKDVGAREWKKLILLFNISV